jgi:multiple sugar transport system permease protein
VPARRNAGATAEVSSRLAGTTRGAAVAPTRPLGRALRAVPWLSPAGLLIFGVVLFPAGYLIYDSTRNVGLSGVDVGPAGLTNYHQLLVGYSLTRVMLNSLIWVVAVVALTVVISLAIAQLLNSQFPGRRWVRMAVLVPWAASVVMTTMTFVYGLDPFYGVINQVLVDLHILDHPYGFTKQAVPAFTAAIGVAIFVSLPFTTYTLLAGLANVPADVLEAATMDGAGAIRRYFSVVLPYLRGAIALATLINVINVFNSLPILKLMTGAIPGYSADTTTTLVFKILQSDHNIGVASALSVVNFAIVLVVIALYLLVVKPMKSIED